MEKRIVNFALASLLGTAVIAASFLLTGSVVARHLVSYPNPPPGLIYLDPPNDRAELSSGRPFWLTSVVLAVMLSAAALPMIRRGLGAWTVAFGLCNPLTFFFGWLVFFLTPWYAYAPTPYQVPLNPWMPVLSWIAVFVVTIAVQRSGTRRA